MHRKKSGSNQILLSVVALLIIVLLGAGITFSWIEGGNTYTIQTQNTGDVKTEDSETLAKALKYKGTIDLKSGSTIDAVSLVDYDRALSENKKSGYNGLYFSPVSSADGKNFFFPINMQGEESAYRTANMNDVGTKFINFEFDVKATENCYLAFDSAPTITAEKGGVAVSDMSAFRFMLSNKDGSKSYIFAPGLNAQTYNGLTNVNGTTKSVTTKLVNKYTYEKTTKQRLFEYDKDETDTLTLSVWLENTGSASSLEELVGSEVTVNIGLRVAQPCNAVTFDAVTYSNADVKLDKGFTGCKSISYNGTSHTTGPFTEQVVVDDTFTAIATAKTNYTFEGWYSDAECNTLVTSSATLEKTPSADVTYYAKFKEKPKYTISVSSKTLPSGTGGTVTAGGSGTSYTNYKDLKVKIKATAATGYTFDGWYTDNSCSTKIGDNYLTEEIEVTISGTKTYYAKFLKNYTVTFKARKGTSGSTTGGGKVQLDSDNADTTVTKSVPHGKTVTLTATADKGYKLLSIHKSTNTTSIASGSSVKVEDTVTYYADFEKLPESKTTIYFEKRYSSGSHNAWVYNEETDVKYSDSTWPGTKITSVDSASGCYKFEFTTEDTGSFHVIVSNGDSGSPQYPAQNQPGLEGTIGKTYLFTKDGELIETDFVTVNASAETGGTAKVNNSASVSVLKGITVTLSATANSGYEFEGWYESGSRFSTSATNEKKITGATTFTAKFTKKPTGKILYLKPNSNWTQASARFACYVWKDGGSSMWINMTGPDGDGIYKTAEAVDTDTYNKVIFVRMNPSNSTNNWDSNNKWNQTGDLSIPSDSKNLFTIPAGSWDGATTSWSTK